MATVEFVPASNSSVRTASDLVTLRAVAALTGSYVSTTDDVETLGWDYVVFRLIYTKGDETTCEVKAQGYDGTNWTDIGHKGDQASGVSPLSSDVMQMPGATSTLTTPQLCVIGFQKVRLQVKATGGTPTGTLGVTATAGITITGRGA